MIKFSCKKCGHLYKVDKQYAEKNVQCKECGSVCRVPQASAEIQYFYKDVHYAADGITPDFDDIFSELLKQEREAPPIAV